MNLARALPFALIAALAHPALAETADSLRLERDVVPLAQALWLRLDPALQDYSGTTTVKLRVLRPTQHVVLHAKDLDLHRVELADSGGRLEVHWGVIAGDRLWIETTRPLVPGPATLSIDFHNDYDTHANALYRFEHDGLPYLATQFESVAAREAFPCWDEPEWKIPWSVSIETRSGQRVIGNTRPLRITAARGWRTVVLRPTTPLPSYLLAFLVGPYESVAMTGLRVPGRIITVRGQTALAEFARRETPGILRALELWFGRPYPYDKLDLIAIPDFVAGAMENAGALTFADAVLLFDPGTISPEERIAFTLTVSHELAHQWFGDLVTMTWWDDLWLNESFANWISTRITEARFPRDVLVVDQARALDRAMTRDARPDTRAIRAPVLSASNLDLLFDEISYEKGEAVLAMLEQWLGRDVFQDGVRNYLTSRAFGSATADDLWKALAAASGRDVAAVARGFTDQPGVPLLTLTQLDEAHLQLRQGRFTSAGLEPDGSRWTLPLTLLALDGARRDSLPCTFASAETTVQIPPGTRAVFPDAGAHAYVRWAQPADQIPALVDGAGALAPRERAQLAPMLGAMLVAGTIRGDAWVEALQRLGRHSDDPIVATLLAEQLNRLRVTFGDTPSAPRAAFVCGCLAAGLTAFGETPRPGEPLTIERARPEVLEALADLGADTALVRRLRPLAEAELAGRDVPPSLARCALIAQSTAADSAWLERLVDTLHTTAEPARRDRLIDAIGAVGRPALVPAALEPCVDPRLSPREVNVLMDRLASDPAHQDAVLDFIEAHHRELAERLPAYSLADLPRRLGGCSLARIERATRFFAAPGHQVTGTLEQLARARAEAEECTALHAREGERVRRAIEAATR